MPSLRDIRHKIKGVSSTKQITNAMKMMSTARLFRATETLKQNKVYNQRLLNILKDIRSSLADLEHPCFKKNKYGATCFIVIGGERGLCGGFNQDLHRYAYETISKYEGNKKIVTLGNKATKFFEKCHLELYRSVPDLNINKISEDIQPICNEVFKQFLSSEINEIIIIYTSFISMSRKELINKLLLPIELTKTKDTKQFRYEFNPTPAIIFDKVLPRYLQNMIYMSVLESQAAEQSARMTAMTSATDRAGEIVDELRIQLNRSRQALITQEINEVISGAQL